MSLPKSAADVDRLPAPDDRCVDRYVVSLLKVPPTSTRFRRGCAPTRIAPSGCGQHLLWDIATTSQQGADAYRALRMRTRAIVAAVVAIVRLLG